MSAFPIPPTKPELITPARLGEQSRRLDVASRPVLPKPRVYDTYVASAPGISAVGQTVASMDIYWEPGDLVGMMLSFNGVSTAAGTTLQAYVADYPYLSGWVPIGGAGLTTTAITARLDYNGGTSFTPGFVNATNLGTHWGGGFVWSQPYIGATTPAAGMFNAKLHFARVAGTGTMLTGAIRWKIIVI